MVLDHSLDPPGHGVAEAGPADVLFPHLEEVLLQLGNWGDVLSGEFVFHEIQGNFNWIQVWRVAWPVNYFEGPVLQELLNPLGGMAGGTVPQEVGTPVHLHERQEVILQDLLVPFSIHCHVGGKKVDPSVSIEPEKQTHTIRLAGCLTVFTVYR